MHPRTRKALKISAAAVSVLIIAAFKVYKVGYANPSCPFASSPPHVIGILRWIRSRDCIGMLRYARQREGDLKVGDRAPDALLVSLDGRSRQPLLQATNGKPTVLVFGSFT